MVMGAVSLGSLEGRGSGPGGARIQVLGFCGV